MTQTIIAILIVFISIIIAVKMAIKALKNKEGNCASCSLKNTCSIVNDVEKNQSKK